MTGRLWLTAAVALVFLVLAIVEALENVHAIIQGGGLF